MTTNITPATIRQALRHLRGDIAALDGLLAEAGTIPPVHATRLALRLDDMRRDLRLLIDMTQRLATPGSEVPPG